MNDGSISTMSDGNTTAMNDDNATAMPFRKHPKPLRGKFTVVLHTRNASALFHGRRDREDQPDIPGIALFAKRCSGIWQDAIYRNPFAIKFMLRIEASLENVDLSLKEIAAELEAEAAVPEGVVMKASVSDEPVKRTVESHSTYPYKAAVLLVRADKIMARIMALRHSGLITQERDLVVTKKVFRVVRGLFCSGDGYHRTKFTFEDLLDEQKAAGDECKKAIDLMGSVDQAILLGEKYPKFGPTMLAPERVKQLRLQMQAQEKAKGVAA